MLEGKLTRKTGAGRVSGGTKEGTHCVCRISGEDEPGPSGDARVGTAERPGKRTAGGRYAVSKSHEKKCCSSRKKKECLRSDFSLRGAPRSRLGKGEITLLRKNAGGRTSRGGERDGTNRPRV